MNRYSLKNSLEILSKYSSEVLIKHRVREVNPLTVFSWSFEGILAEYGSHFASCVRLPSFFFTAWRNGIEASAVWLGFGYLCLFPAMACYFYLWQVIHNCHLWLHR